MHTVRSLAAACAALATGSLMLNGCAGPAKGPLSATQQADLHQAVIRVLGPMNQAANKDWLSGAVSLEVTIDRNNQLLKCAAKPTSGAPGLAAVAERACWATVFPPVPAQAFNADGQARLRMPIVFDMDPVSDPQLRARYEGIAFPAFSQGQYFWDHGIAAVGPTSVGEARFQYVADRQGRVLACTASIAPAEAREGEFRDNPHLLERLNGACLQMNLAAMPGFAAGNNGLANGTVWTSYSPWRQAAPQPKDY
ncbi:hypothetical protein [Pseudomonas sp. NPDC007930]|uniref:hypothetical protein n=1 Tax=Pseudomonas sp. NPDC007930 TaxID=3364417 RepID=UPI0036DFE0B9